MKIKTNKTINILDLSENLKNLEVQKEIIFEKADFNIRQIVKDIPGNIDITLGYMGLNFIKHNDKTIFLERDCNLEELVRENNLDLNILKLKPFIDIFFKYNWVFILDSPILYKHIKENNFELSLSDSHYIQFIWESGLKSNVSLSITNKFSHIQSQYIINTGLKFEELQSNKLLNYIYEKSVELGILKDGLDDKKFIVDFSINTSLSGYIGIVNKLRNECKISPEEACKQIYLKNNNLKTRDKVDDILINKELPQPKEIKGTLKISREGHKETLEINCIFNEKFEIVIDPSLFMV